MSEAMYLEDYAVGESFSTPGRTVTETDVVNFAGLTGDWFELHTNEEFASNTRFGGRIAHGALSFSLLTGLIIRRGLVHKESLVALYGVDDLRFTNPVYPGDTLRADVTIEDKEKLGDGGIVVMGAEMRNERDDLVLKCDVEFMVEGRETST